MSLYDITVNDWQGNPVSLSKYKGKALEQPIDFVRGGRFDLAAVRHAHAALDRAADERSARGVVLEVRLHRRGAHAARRELRAELLRLGAGAPEMRDDRGTCIRQRLRDGAAEEALGPDRYAVQQAVGRVERRVNV